MIGRKYSSIIDTESGARRLAYLRILIQHLLSNLSSQQVGAARVTMINPGAAEPDSTIQSILQKPGCAWAVCERRRIWEWLFSEPQITRAIYACLYALGSSADLEDAEDFWSKYCQDRLNKIIDLFDPTLSHNYQNFWSFLLFCLRRDSHKQGQAITRLRQRERPLQTEHLTHRGEIVEDEDFRDDSQGDPLDQLADGEFIQLIRQALDWLRATGKGALAEAFERVHLNEESPKIVAGDLGVTANLISVRVNRAANEIKQFLWRNGWPE